MPTVGVFAFAELARTDERAADSELAPFAGDQRWLAEVDVPHLEAYVAVSSTLAEIADDSGRAEEIMVHSYAVRRRVAALAAFDEMVQKMAFVNVAKEK